MKHINETYPKPSSICNCMNIRRASKAVTQFYDDVIKPSGLTLAQLWLLLQIKMAKETNISDLAKRLRLDRTTLNRNLKPLLEAGLITINQGEDSRTRLVMLTEAGEAAVELGSKLWNEAQGEIQEYLGNEDWSKFSELMAKLEALVP